MSKTGKFADLFVRKEVNTDMFKKTGLDKTLSAFSLTTMGVGAIVGAGIFITPGIIAASYSGPGVWLSYLVAAVVCSLAALCYSEFSSTIPLAGSAYTYIYAVFGELIAWILGWALISEYLFAVSSVAVSWSAYFQNVLAGFNIHLPAIFRAAYGTAGSPRALFDLPAFLITMIIAYLLVQGVRESAKVNAVMVILKIAVIVLFIVVAAFYIRPTNYSPMLPFGAKGVIRGAAVAFYAYIGFDAVSTASEEVKNPKRDMPIGIVSSLIVASVLYILLSVVLVGVVHYTKLNVADPVAFALHFIHQNWVAGIVSLGAVVGMTTVLIVMLYGGTRLIFAISRDGLLPSALHKLNPQTHVPTINTWALGFIASVFAGIIPLTKIAELVNIGTLFAFAMVSLGVVFLRKDRRFRDLPKSFEVPFYPVIPIISFLACIYLMLQLASFTWMMFGIWLAIGLIVYFGYGFSHSHARQNEEK
ncbi:amino acid permease [Pediococcus inopinatus]|uniref:APC family permease n=1 Tax=Pediococcus TaxID=1253 RepID=UPI00070C9D62|nr:amino acid permease [Pediococcus inopinatus]AVK99647.1 amino acid permease [Pediococcus inopinatus]KRN63859.1 amino acid transporter [Pediococcus inopinatus]WPC18736.1 amino acid permease [Pediococcus inopinatus]WPP08715.1 amino acid permease [Pediococcus inopinatus]